MKRYCLGEGYVGADGKRGRYTLGVWSKIGLHSVKEGKQTNYNQIALQIPDSLDSNKTYTLFLEENNA